MTKKTVLLLAALALIQGCVETAPKRDLAPIFYPSLPQRPQLQFLTSITSQVDVGNREAVLDAFLTDKDDSARLSRPHYMAVRPGKLYVSDMGYGLIIIIDFEKKEFRPLNAQREGTLKNPEGIAVLENGLLFVADSGRNRIVVFDAEDRFVRLYGSDDIFRRPVDVAVYGDRLYVCDHAAHAVHVLDRESGKPLQTIGGRGSGPGEFDFPTHLRVDREGNLYVNDSFNFRIQKFDANGNYLHEFGYHSGAVGGFARPKGFDVAPDGRLYVADAAFENVQIFTGEDQSFSLSFGNEDDEHGRMAFPSAVAIDHHNVKYFRQHADKGLEVKYLVYVGNMLGKRKINIYGAGNWADRTSR